MLKMKTPRTRREEFDYALCFDSIAHPGSGYSFPCTKEGKLLPLKPIAQESLTHAQNKELYRGPSIETFVRRWTEPAVGTCSCGHDVTLRDPLTNLCDCGRAYNMSGQEVDPGWREYDEDF
jgi:hypothetical protein